MTRLSPDDAGPRSRSDRTLQLLEERFDEVTVGDLADAVFRDDDDAESPGAVHEDLFRRVLPALEERGELRFDVDRGIVTVTDDDGLLERLRERLSR